MDPILAEIYSTIIPSAPYVIAAYAIVWAALFVYLCFILRGIKRTERQVSLLEELIGESSKDLPESEHEDAHEY